MEETDLSKYEKDLWDRVSLPDLDETDRKTWKQLRHQWVAVLGFLETFVSQNLQVLQVLSEEKTEAKLLDKSGPPLLEGQNYLKAFQDSLEMNRQLKAFLNSLKKCAWVRKLALSTAIGATLSSVALALFSHSEKVKAGWRRALVAAAVGGTVTFLYFYHKHQTLVQTVSKAQQLVNCIEKASFLVHINIEACQKGNLSPEQFCKDVLPTLTWLVELSHTVPRF